MIRYLANSLPSQAACLANAEGASMPVLPDWGRITSACMKIPGCLVPKFIDGKRARIESIIHHSSSGPEVLDLRVIALSPNGNPVASYEIMPSISPALGRVLEKILNPPPPTDSATQDQQPVERIADSFLGDLNSAIGPTSDAKWELIPEKHNGKKDALMERKAPSFAELATWPAIALDRQFETRKRFDDRIISVKATLLLDRRKVALDVRVTDLGGKLMAEEYLPLSFPLKDPFRPPTQEFVHKELLKMTWDSMAHLWEHGLDSLRDKLSQPTERPTRFPAAAKRAERQIPRSVAHNDERLLRGDRSEGEEIARRSLPSGALISVRLGERVGLLTIQANESDLSSSVTWIARDDRGISETSSVVRESLLKASDFLASPRAEHRRSTLGFLDRLMRDTTGLNPIVCGGSLDEVLTFSLQTDLGTLRNISFESVAAASHEQVLELMNGVQLVQLTLSHPQFKSSTLTSFNKVLFGVYPDESLYLRARTPLGGQVRARISADTCGEVGGYREVVRTIAEKLSKSTSAPKSRIAVQQEIESFVNMNPDTNTFFSPSDELGFRLPPIDNVAANKAYDAAGKLARIWSRAAGGHYSDLQVEWVEGTSLCKASIGDIGPDRGAMELFISAEGITKVAMRVETPESPGRGRRFESDFRSNGASPLRRSEVINKLFTVVQSVAEGDFNKWQIVERLGGSTS